MACIVGSVSAPVASTVFVHSGSRNCAAGSIMDAEVRAGMSCEELAEVGGTDEAPRRRLGKYVGGEGTHWDEDTEGAAFA